MEQEEIGQRVLSRIASSRTHREIANAIGMTPDAFSRALNGKRAFSSIELARVADVLGADVHWLITGREDPQRVRVAARHHFDHESGEHSVPGRDEDDAVLADVALAYRQAYPDADRPSAALPGTVEEVRDVLGPGFVRSFADRVEQCLDVDVVRVPGLSTDYSFTLGGRHVILLAAHANWFRSNWSLAHELAHLVLCHHGVRNAGSAQERAANAFAAQLLLPEAELRSRDWQVTTGADLARFVWDAGVSGDVLIRRVDSLRLPVSEQVRRLLGGPTQRLLRRHLGDTGEKATGCGPFVIPVDPITARMDAAAARRFPLTLQDAHVRRIAKGQITPGTLAWMLDTTEDDLVVDQPEPSGVAADDLAAALGL